MRIAYVVHKLPPQSVGGVEVYTWSLARQLSALGHAVHVFYPLRGAQDEPTRIEREGVHLWRVLLPPQRGGSAAAATPRRFWHSVRHAGIERSFAAFLRAVDPEVVHLQHVQDVSVRLIALARGRPRILSLHDYWYLCPNGQLVLPDRALCPYPVRAGRCAACALARSSSPLLAAARPVITAMMAWRNAAVRCLLGQVDLLLTPSDFSRDIYVRYGCDPTKIRVFDLGLDPARLAAPDEEAAADEAQRGAGLRDAGVPDARLRLGYLGAIAWQKGLHVLIEAVNRLPEDVTLTIYGDPTVFPEYTAALRAATHHPGIRFAGPLPYDAVGPGLRQLDYLVAPSVWFETFAMVAQEAEAVGTPVVASRIGALTRIKDGVTGRLFEPGDAAELARVLRDLYDHPDLRDLYRQRLSPGATLPCQAANLVELYRGIIERRAPL